MKKVVLLNLCFGELYIFIIVNGSVFMKYEDDVVLENFRVFKVLGFWSF